MKSLLLALIVTTCWNGNLFYVGPGVDVPTLVVEDGELVKCAMEKEADMPKKPGYPKGGKKGK